MLPLTPKRSPNPYIAHRESCRNPPRLPASLLTDSSSCASDEDDSDFLLLRVSADIVPSAWCALAFLDIPSFPDYPGRVGPLETTDPILEPSGHLGLSLPVSPQSVRSWGRGRCLQHPSSHHRALASAVTARCLFKLKFITIK